MPIERSFEALTPVPPEEVFEVFSDIQTHIPLWSIYESMRLESPNEAEVTLRISGSIYKLRMKLTSQTRRASRTVFVDGKGSIYFHMRLNIEPRGIGSIVTGRIYVKAGFFRERILSPGITEFLDDLKNKIMFQLPAIAEVIRRRKKELKAEAAATTSAPKATAPKVPPSPAKQQAKAKLKQPKPSPRPKPVQKPAPKQKELIAKNPDALSDEITVGMIVLKAELIKVEKFSGDWKKVIDFAKSVLKEVGEKKPLYIRFKTDETDIKLLIKEGKVIGVRVDLPNGKTLNGDKALAHLKDAKGFSGRTYVFSVPEEALAGT